MLTILDIADLHRSHEQPVSNAELISSLLADCERYSAEQPAIPRPNAIVLSGDLVQGLPLNSPDYPYALKAQYDEALSFLVMLSEEFLQGDRSKLIIVPGNHDVDWNIAHQALSRVKLKGHDVYQLLSSPGSGNMGLTILITLL